MAGLFGIGSSLLGSAVEPKWMHNYLEGTFPPLRSLSDGLVAEITEWIQPKISFSVHYDPTPIVFTIRYNTDMDKFAKEFNPDLEKNGVRKGKIIFITHGFNSGSASEWMQDMRRALCDIDHGNIVGALDWTKDAVLDYTDPLFSYPRAAENCLAVGRWLGQKAKVLSRKLGHAFEIWGVGHSLGAHLMGMAGESSGVFTRISGLDPAGFGFSSGTKGYRRLGSKDAKRVVDVIHTDGAPCKDRPYYFGTLIPMGTIDFYPDFGVRKPSKLGVVGVVLSDSPHSLAYKYFIWSIKNSGKFITKEVLNSGWTCQPPNVKEPEETKDIRPADKAAEMGYFVENAEGKSGHYFLATNAKEPWAPKEEKSWYNIF